MHSLLLRYPCNKKYNILFKKEKAFISLKYFLTSEVVALNLKIRISKAFYNQKIMN